ncbi:MAG TPA: Type 1 glutamine amidotransferase-like domain-containing protein [Thermoanaerobaculia bacterium]|nr:Type 1 glutamine amidotransferase-like domain-containing protein [Thermoanaerobaculia bacterium]
MTTSLKPIFLLADSQLLFWRDEEGKRFLARAQALLAADEPGRALKGAYLGASNGDLPEFFDLFVAAMAEIGIRDCRHVPAHPGEADLEALQAADVILLAGGDVRRGWQAFAASPLKDKIVERYYAGAILFGVSAGAVQLGLKGWSEDGEVFDTFRLVPFVVDVHDEPSWSGLLRAVSRAGENARGFGIPAGGGAVYHPDYSVEPVRHPLTEVEATEGGLRQALLMPGKDQETAAGEPPRVMSQEEVVSRVLRDLEGAEPEGGDSPDGSAGDSVN